MKTIVTFFNDGTLDLQQPHGKGTKHMLFDSVSELVNYLNENNIDVDMNDVETL